MAFINKYTKTLIDRFKHKENKNMKTLSIVIHYDKTTMRRLKERGMFSDDPQWLFNAHFILDSARDVVFRSPRHDLSKIEDFLAQEDIPYTRTLGKGE